MPEEINRIVADHISDYLFAPTETSRENLLKEGIPNDKIFVTGNTVVDAAYQNLELSKRHINILQNLNLKSKHYFLVTAHRAENVDIPERLNNILTALREIRLIYNMPVLFPMHPRTVKMVAEFGFSLDGITVIKPVGYLEFLQLEENASVILTDSGGLQEEGCILGTPCITLRDNTERPETIEVGANVLAGTNTAVILNCVNEAIHSTKTWINPFGEGKAGEQIVSIIQ